MGPMNPGDMAFEGALIQANVLVLYGSLAVVGRSRICSFSISRDCDRSSSYDAEHSGWWHFTNAIFNTHLTLNALSHTGFPHVIHNVPRDEGLADLKSLSKCINSKSFRTLFHLQFILIMPSQIFSRNSSLFSLDSSGVAGFFGGDVAVQAMTTVHLYQGRRWRGWYNSPGSYEIAKQYGRLAASRFWDGLYPGPNVDPAVLFGLDGQAGPQYVAAHSGTVMPQTGHLAYLFLQHCKELTVAIDAGGRKTTPIRISIAELGDESPNIESHPKLLKTYFSLFSVIPITVSFVTSWSCCYFRDWFCGFMILLGIISSGLSCLVLGSGKFTFTHPNPAKGAPNGNGFLESSRDFVVLLGSEGMVNSLTRGHFSLRFEGEPRYHLIGCCSMLLTMQFLAQLLLIPQGTLFGQIMFLSSLAASWIYNCYLASLDTEQVQRHMLVEEVLGRPSVRKYELGTRTAAVVLVTLVLKPINVEDQLEQLLPNKTHVWRKWRETVARKIINSEPFVFDQMDFAGIADDELLRTLYGDATVGYRSYLQHQQQECK